MIQIPEVSYIDRGKTRTFKPRRDVPEGTKQYQLRKYAEATLVRSRMCDVLHHKLIFQRVPEIFVLR
jgi:hypothetical protein